MMRFARVVCCVVVTLLVAARGQAQTPAADDSSRAYAEFDVAATFGHHSSGSLGGEAGYKLTPLFTVFLESGHMFDVGSSDLDARAATIASDLGANYSAKYTVNYLDFGVRYTPDVQLSMVHPYLTLGFGAAEVNANTVLTMNGTPVPPDVVQFGVDLNGVVWKGYVMFGGGVTYPFQKRYFVDGSLRYGRILARTSVIPDDTGINTFRLQVGVGVRFWQ